MRGPKPKPTKLKILNGNPGRRPLNDREPQPGGMPVCPEWLDTYAKTVWRRLAPKLAKMGLSFVDREAFACYCQSCSDLKTARAMLAKEGITVETKLGAVMEHPAVRTANKAMMQIRAFGSEFGLTPSSRSRLSIDAEQSSDDPMEAILRGRRSG
jgi:P27 family predicted phage terminase small subunit